jgi:hypothetical protein
MSRDRVVVRAYGVLVKLYPRRFRDEYGDDLVAMFRDQCRDESPWRVGSRAALDLAITIPSQRVEATMHRSPRALVPLIYLAIAFAGFAIAIVGGTDPTPIVIGLAVAFGAGSLAVVSWRRTSARSSSTSASGTWWKLLLAGPGLVAVVIVAARLGVEAWYLGMLTLLVAFVLTAVGLGLGVAQLLNHRHPQDPPVSFSSGAS